MLDLLAGRDETVTLDQAALELARIEFPSLDAQPSLALLDSFGELSFKGNATNYYDPLNSCLNHVLTSRTGIP